SSPLSPPSPAALRPLPPFPTRRSSDLTPYHPYLRGAPPGLPFRWDAQTLERGLNFTLTTDLGALDLLGEITGGGRYAELLAHTRSEEHTSELQSRFDLVCRLLLEKKKQ